jgi:hypothetical protein
LRTSANGYASSTDRNTRTPNGNSRSCNGNICADCNHCAIGNACTTHGDGCSIGNANAANG